jgi:Holliday junction DNA helicase RuvB
MLDNAQERLRIWNLLTENPSWRDVLAEALVVEEQKEKEYQEAGYGQFIGWEWHMVHCPIPTLHRMVAEKLLDITLSTRSSKHFKIHNPELIKEMIEFFKNEEEQKVEVPKEIPNDLFASIVGHDNIKSLLRLAIEAESPAHVLLSGPPASSKTLFLLELNRLPDSYYALAPTLTEAGLSNLLFIYRPKFLIVDEVDRLPGSELGQLNSLMATGRVVETKWGKTRSVDLNTKVFAAGIRINRLPQDLLSRFIKLRFPAYSESEFISVGTTVLTTREGIVPDKAEEISRAVWQMHAEQSDIRQVVSIARLSGGDPMKVKEVLQTIRKYGVTRLDQALG